MNSPAGKSLWEQTVAAARQGAPASAPAVPDLPPPGFATRLAACWVELRQNEAFRRWCRWSLRAALAGLIAAAAVHFFAPVPATPHPLRVPGVELPPLSAP